MSLANLNKNKNWLLFSFILQFFAALMFLNMLLLGGDIFLYGVFLVWSTYWASRAATALWWSSESKDETSKNVVDGS